jgi:hypothetical protein
LGRRTPAPRAAYNAGIAHANASANAETTASTGASSGSTTAVVRNGTSWATTLSVHTRSARRNDASPARSRHETLASSGSAPDAARPSSVGPINRRRSAGAG